MYARGVETSRLYGRGIAAIDPQWLEEVGAHLSKKPGRWIVAAELVFSVTW